MIDTLMFLQVAGIGIQITMPSFTIVSVLYIMVLVFLLFGISAFIIYLRQVGIQGNGAPFKQPRRLGTIFSTGVLVLPLLGFLIVGANFLPSFSIFPQLAPTYPGTVVSSTPNSNHPSLQVTPPNDLVIKGTLTVGSTLTYLPQDFGDENKPMGFDIDLITAIAKQMGLKVKVKNEGFEALSSDLKHHKLDVVISALSTNATSQADFVPYLQSMESFLILKNNPESNNPNLTINDLCGKNVGVLSGSSTINDVNNTNGILGSCKFAQINSIAKSDTNSIVQLLLNQQIDVAYLDNPVATYYMQQNSAKLSVVGLFDEHVQEGIAVRPGDDTMNQAVTQALQVLQSDGTYNRLLKTNAWDFSSEAYTVQ